MNIKSSIIFVCTVDPLTATFCQGCRMTTLNPGPAPLFHLSDMITLADTKRDVYCYYSRERNRPTRQSPVREILLEDLL